MPFSPTTPAPCQWFSLLAALLDVRSAPRLVRLLHGAVLAAGRRTVTSWLRAAGVTDEFRPAYTTVAAAGKRTDLLAARLAHAALQPMLSAAERLNFGIDDTPTQRYGPEVEGAGIRHNPTPGPSAARFVYGHVWVTLAWLAHHPAWGAVALPLLARLYVRRNVLLAEDGTPKVTDFGLAKKLDEAGQTQSGAVMGTPSYMAPEQAGGKSPEIGPLADVYALGAILYECLSGRPPFKAATALDTMMQVVADEPVPPRQLQSQTPRDLETICLKHLHHRLAVVGRHQDVGGLEVPVDDPLLVRVLHRPADVAEQRQPLAHAQALVVAVAGDRLPLDQFHHEVRTRTRGAGIGPSPSFGSPCPSGHKDEPPKRARH
jgi:hypothetical protein